MYVILQNWIYLLLAFALGMLIAWLLGLCNCDRAGLESELDEARRERDDLAAKLAAGGGLAVAGAALAGRDDGKVAALEAELAEARVRADSLAADLAKARSTAGASAGDDEEGAAMRWRNRYLEARVKFLEDQHAADTAAVAGAGAAPVALAALAGAAVAADGPAKRTRKKAEPKAVETKAVPAKRAEPDNDTFEPSPLAALDAEALEAAVIAAGAGTPPRRSRARRPADDLLLIDGVGPKNLAWLNEQGIRYFWQIATMNVAEVAWLAENLPTFGSRVYRENWVAQCARLAKGLSAKP